MQQIRWFIPLLLFYSIPGSSQYNPDSVSFIYPDTTLSLEQSLLFVEKATGIYFSYNPVNLGLDDTLELSHGPWKLSDFIRMIIAREDLQYTLIDNQIVFHRPDEVPGDSIPEMTAEPIVSRTVRGQVLSLSDEDPLAFSTIWIPSTWQGTVANTEGFFIIKLTGTAISDSLAVSCMGYQTRFISLAALNDSLNLIHLPASIIPIQEVIVRRTEPLSLIRLALEKMPDNYYQEPVIETAFYRESILKNDRYINISEAVLNIYKPGNDGYTTEQVKVLKGRRNLDLQETDTLLIKLQGGLQTSFLLDISRNPPDFLDPDKFKYFEYQMSDIITMQGQPTYAIDFTQKMYSNPPHYQGRIYIDLETLAFRGAEFEVNPRTISRLTNAMVLRKPRNLHVRPISAAYQVLYKEEGNKFYLSLIRADNRFRIKERRKLFGSVYRTVSEMAITQLRTEDVKRFKPRETTRITDVFTDLLGGFEQAFWGPYNYLIPEEKLEDAMKQFGNNLELPSDPDLQ